MRAVPTDHTAKRLLVGSIGSVYIITHIASLRGIRTLDSDGGDASFGGIPGELLGEVCQVGGVQIGVHGTRLELHGGHGELFVGELAALVLLKALVDRAVDLLAHMASQALPALAAGGGELFDPFLFEACPQFGLAPPLLAVALLPLSEFAMKGAVVLPFAGGQEVGDAHVHADHRGRWGGVDRDDLVVGERHPPAIIALVERHAGIDGLAFERLAMVGSQLDWDQQLLAEFQRADREPVVKGRVLGGFELDDVGVGWMQVCRSVGMFHSFQAGSCAFVSRVPSVCCS